MCLFEEEAPVINNRKKNNTLFYFLKTNICINILKIRFFKGKFQCQITHKIIRIRITCTIMIERIPELFTTYVIFCIVLILLFFSLDGLNSFEWIAYIHKYFFLKCFFSKNNFILLYVVKKNIFHYNFKINELKMS